MKRGRAIPHKTLQDLERRAQGRCEIMLAGCAYYGCDPHHRKLRSRGGSNDLGNLLLACRPCHDKVTSPRHAEETAHFRTHKWHQEGMSEEGMAWQPKDRSRPL